MGERARLGRGVLRALVVAGVVVTVAALVPLIRGWWVPPGSTPVVMAPLAAPTRPTVALWLSTADRRLQLARQADVPTTLEPQSPVDITIDLARRFQTIDGFGAALTDASAWLLRNRMSPAQRASLLREVFGPPPALNFNLLRLTIGGSDFSLTHYTLDDMPAGDTDPDLAHFNLAANQRDLIPTLREALAINPQLRLIASPWSAPAWMKTSANLIGGSLLEQYEGAYAAYLLRYVDAYARLGLPIDALTIQNEPNFVPMTYPGMQLDTAARERIIGQYLGPALATRQPRTRILGWDHNWDTSDEPLAMLADPVAGPYVDGIAWHCYRGGAQAQGLVHRAFTRAQMYITECSGGDWPSSRNGELMWFARDLLMAGLKNWARGVLYWNLALDENYGPHAGGCSTCKGVVTVDTATGRITRNDYYYAFAHWSAFVRRGAVRVGSSGAAHGLDNVALQNPHDGSVVLVVVNSNTAPRQVTVAQGATRFRYTMPGQSVATLVWQPQSLPSSVWPPLRKASPAGAGRLGMQ